MRREPLPDVLHLWGIPWVKHGDVWEGPPVVGPDDPMLRMALAHQRIEVSGDRYVLADPWLTLDRFTWHDGDLSLPWPEEAPPCWLPATPSTLPTRGWRG